MITSVLLEVGNLGGVVLFFIALFGGAAIVISLIIAFVFKYIYQFNNKKKLPNKAFWLIIFISLSLCGIIAGAICL